MVSEVLLVEVWLYHLLLYFRMRHGKVALKLGTHQKYYISHCEEKHSIQLTITVAGNDVPSIQERRELIDDVNKMLNNVMKGFMPAAVQPVLFVPCPRCPNLHITFSEVCAGGISYCCTFEEDIALRDHYHDLMIPFAGIIQCTRESNSMCRFWINGYILCYHTFW